MKNTFYLTFLAICLSTICQGQQLQGSAQANLDVTNINAKIFTGGDMFGLVTNNFPYQHTPGFEVPRGSGKLSIFTGGLWLGGRDTQNNLYVASQTYRQFGMASFWPGPIATSQSSNHNITYDKIWKVSHTQIQQHVLNFNSASYIMPTDIATWPGNGNITNGEAAQLAPFIDFNNDGVYNPNLGDYPAIKGDQALYLILNEKGNIKQPASRVMNAEIHIMYYGFNNPANGWVNNTIFADYRVINRGQNNLLDFYAGLYVDFDLGNFNDDFVGCDTLTNRFFVYNGDNDDEGPNGYGIAPPVQSVMFLTQPMGHFLYYENSNHKTKGNPATNIAMDYYNYMRGVWRDGKLVTNGEDGTNQTNQPVRYMFPGNPVTQQGWSEMNRLDTPSHQLNAPGDRRGIGSIGPFNLLTGQELNFTVAFTYSRGNSNLNSITVANQDAQAVQNFWSNNIMAASKASEADQKMFLLPNPAQNECRIFLPESIKNKPATISVTDYLGKTVLLKNISAGNENPLTINLEDFSKGIYLVQAAANRQVVRSKLIKQ